ncbi:transcription factor bHLH18 [Cajanus cajan]|uniref:Transcription factor bHLH25 n=1 Tax=Cajanus cajan TaxID=3821 RepID=A0A151TAQ8_CAJCA|nr:transcription factor bHLH18 [Cajanus cajan]KYP64142.1 Transcription factor bHLH25 [Cajanus cajan]
MEDSLENWISQMDEVLNESDRAFDEEEFLRGILEHEREHPSNSSTNSSVSIEEATTSLRGRSGTLKSNSSNSIKSFKTSCATYLLSFDNSSAEPITHIEPSPKGLGLGCSNKRTAVKELEEWKPQPKKKIRRSSDSQHHIIAERKRRQELTGSIIALSAIIPGLKKMDKAYVLGEAINYTKQLQERVKELENQNKDKRVDSATLVRKSQSNDNGETNTESLFEVEVRVLDEEVFIGIHCEKQKDTVFKIHALLGKLHLSVNTSSVLPFGSSTLVINIIAQMDEGYKMTMDELVKKLREYLLEVYDSNNGPC